MGHPARVEPQDFVSIRVHSGIGLEARSAVGSLDPRPHRVSIRVHSGIGLEVQSNLAYQEGMEQVSIRVHSGIGLEV